MKSSHANSDLRHRPQVALVNNMPDAAFLDTETQFRLALDAASPDPGVDLRLYSLPGLLRSDAVELEIETRYRPLEDLWLSHPAALIVTGTEPSQTALPYEPYWPHLAHLLQWAADHVDTALLSCLAAHASILLFDGIDRRPLAHKLHGVYACETPPGSPDFSLPHGACMPHSRINEVPVADMRRAGYSILAADGDTSWSAATRRQGARSQFVLCQGHPEYSVDSLLREYRRDLRRALTSRGTVPLPELPVGYLDPDSRHQLERFSARAAAPGADPDELWQHFPYDEVAARLQRTWAVTSDLIFSRWLALATNEPG